MANLQNGFPWETPPELWRGLKPEDGRREGTVSAIFIAPTPSAPMISVQEARAMADRGLEGDRFFRESWRAAKRPDKSLTLIEEETLELAAAELGHDTIAGKTRRNIVTRGMPLITLLNREFTIGGVLLRGLRLFEPCPHMEKLSGIPGIFKALECRSGLKAEILSDGVIRVGDTIEMRPGSEDAAAAARG